ncbi:hypothetical protein [Hymenobacter armeniacus]|uniref:hypothetical protein n=1 Tax=Hymenobacter armeniacus TaxID=2771358 RepID=UPI001683F4A6|nr:hypothetical protein [Hymenobacter armeniacus]
MLRRIQRYSPGFLLAVVLSPLARAGLRDWAVFLFVLGPPLLIGGAVYGVFWRLRPLHVVAVGPVLLVSVFVWMMAGLAVGLCRVACLQGGWGMLLVVAITASFALLVASRSTNESTCQAD